MKSLKLRRKLKDDAIDSLNENDFIQVDTESVEDVKEWADSYLLPALQAVAELENPDAQVSIDLNEDKTAIVIEGISGEAMEELSDSYNKKYKNFNKIRPLLRLKDSQSTIEADIDKVIKSFGKKWKRWNEEGAGTYDLYPDKEYDGFIVYEETFAEKTHLNEVAAKLNALGYSLEDNDSHHDSDYYYFMKEKVEDSEDDESQSEELEVDVELDEDSEAADVTVEDWVENIVAPALEEHVNNEGYDFDVDISTGEDEIVIAFTPEIEEVEPVTDSFLNVISKLPRRSKKTKIHLGRK